MIMADVAPKKVGRTAAGGTARKGTSAKTATKSQIQEALKEQTAVVGMMFAIKGDIYPSMVMEHAGPEWAKQMAELAEHNPQLKRVLTLATQGGVTGAAIFSTVVMVLPILAYYNVVPAVIQGHAAQLPLRFDTVDPEELQNAWMSKHGVNGVDEE